MRTLRPSLSHFIDPADGEQRNPYGQGDDDADPRATVERFPSTGEAGGAGVVGGGGGGGAIAASNVGGRRWRCYRRTRCDWTDIDGRCGGWLFRSVLLTTQHDSGETSFNRTVAMWVYTILTATPKEVVLVRISAGRVAKDITDYRSAGARERVEHERAQARCHGADAEVQRDVGGRGAGIFAGVVCVQGHGNFGAASISQSGRAKQCPRNEEKNEHYCCAQNRNQRFIVKDWKTQLRLILFITQGKCASPIMYSTYLGETETKYFC